MKYHVYILHSSSHNKYYIGQTSNLEIRLIQHNSHDNMSYTSKFRPWTLMTSLELNDRRSAMRVEKYLKKKNRAFIKRVINEEDLRAYIISKFSGYG